MTDYSFQAEFRDVYVDTKKATLKPFIHVLLKKQYTLHWRYEEEKVHLHINGYGDSVAIPIEKNDQGVMISFSYISILSEPLAEALEELIAVGKGQAIVKTVNEGPIYVTSFENGQIVSMMKIGEGESVIMETDRNVERYTLCTRDIDPDVQCRILQMEIDYRLMELYEAMESHDSTKKAEVKDELKELVKTLDRMLMHPRMS
ncbi:hypothetical protein [Texcoconibacillus texcoconensis]|uniref:Uncharacterized protein n=1 Tax=Texcoconibacillus texcoconensis TaxID=1095777 RepID=A0A840QSK5_9BACI|nr:hypothetical protein [Texcoconibacillus texcoconensis]MBB5174330.1 hypothetical protein [Texcoconibacillus texcoconensis]